MSFLKKFGQRSRERAFTDRANREQDPDSVLADDDDRDPFSVNITGTLDLTIPDDESNNATTPTYDAQSPHLLPLNVDPPGTVHVAFEVTSAEVIKDQRSSYVLYTILVSSSSGVERLPTTVDRRYSDFEKLNSVLKKKHPHIMEDVSFPRKLLVGNFSSETIAHRSRSFEQYLSHVFSVYELRYSNELAAFFYLNDAKEGYSLLCSEQYLEAISLFEKCLPVCEKLYGGGHLRVVSLLHALVVCYHAIEKLNKAQKYAEVALKSTNDPVVDEPSIALIKLSIRLCWSLGKDKQDLEKRLQELKARKINVDNVPDLKDIVKLNTLV
ncbi:sorting nexin-21-like [Haliotis rufescens]|uniref:sorting nexin-21-like n=1 Tax=Haliotis rufescens TaxID=6454 RepID=UPI001EAFA26F|nr:sorting nexin-21-like [Haliotis rufescens]